MKQNDSKESDDFEEFEEFLEFKRMKQQYEIENDKPVLDDSPQEKDLESGRGFFVMLGIISWVLSGGYVLIDESVKQQQAGIGIFIALSLFFIWGYNVNKPVFYLIARLYFCVFIIWVAWKMEIFV